MRRHIKPAITLFSVLTLMTGLLYPLLVTALAQIFFPARANGSLVEFQGRTIGSRLIGQQFTEPRYFWPRLSASGSFPYNSSASGGSNYSVLNENLARQARDRLAKLNDSECWPAVPVDLVTASGSGLDPDISPAAAHCQVNRVAAARGLPVDQVDRLVDEHTEPRQMGVFGEPHVNVLMLNLALDALQ